MAKHLVLVGGGHAHLTVLTHLNQYIEKGHHATVISSAPYHYYSGMGPGLLAGTYQPQEVRFNIKKMSEDRGARFIEGEVVQIDAQKSLLHTANGDRLHYDVVSFNVGSTIPTEGLDCSDERIVPVKPILNLYKIRLAISRMPAAQPLNILLVGGGPAGIEVAGNVWRLLQNDRRQGIVIVVGGDRILDGLPEKARLMVKDSFAERHITIIEGARVQAFKHKHAVLSDGREIPFDFAILAVGVKPPELFKLSGMPVGPGGGLLVNEYLQSAVHPHVFGGGDCIEIEGDSLAKVGVHAVRQNPILKHNLMVALTGGSMKRFKPRHNFMLILNMGNDKGVLKKNNWIWNGGISFWLKDYIDRRFMKKFQVCGELLEPLSGELY